MRRSAQLHAMFCLVSILCYPLVRRLKHFVIVQNVFQCRHHIIPTCHFDIVPCSHAVSNTNRLSFSKISQDWQVINSLSFSSVYLSSRYNIYEQCHHVLVRIVLKLVWRMCVWKTDHSHMLSFCVTGQACITNRMTQNPGWRWSSYR
jgi:hypothetical protein